MRPVSDNKSAPNVGMADAEHAPESDSMLQNDVWNPNNLVMPLGQNRWRVFQPNYRRNLVVDNGALTVINFLAGCGESGATACALQNFDGDQFGFIDATKFTLIENALLNSAMFDENAANDDLLMVDLSEFMDALREGGFVSSSWPINYQFEKQGFADRFKGNFYEQVGTECLLNRQDPTEWWVAQKFEPGCKTTRPTPYKYIEEKFLDGYFQEEMKDRDVLEIGCGTGYYTNRIAQHADYTVGIDYNANYIETARKVWLDDGNKDADYAVCNIIDLKTDREELVTRKYDRIILIDTFLFLFDSVYQKDLYQNRERILGNITNMLGKDGKLIIMDPHPMWLTPMLGDPNSPVAVLDSYNTRHFKVVPGLEEITALFASAGLRIVRVLEPRIDEGYADIDLLGYNFYKEFPAWWLFELERC